MRDGTRYEATSFGLCLKDRGPGFAELRDVCLDVKDRIYIYIKRIITADTYYTPL